MQESFAESDHNLRIVHPSLALVQGLWFPTASTYSEYSDWLQVMNRRFFLTPPKHRFAQGSGRIIRPINSPSGDMQWTPSVPGPPQPALDHRLPSRSVRMPSGTPGAISAKTWPPRNFRPSTTSKARM